MSNLVELFNDVCIDVNNSDDIFEEIKNHPVYRYIDIDNKKKSDLQLLANNLNNYKNNINNDYLVFGNSKIKMTDEQKNIVHAPLDINMRIIACAGSGKTTTILARVKYLIDNYVLPNKILILTFNVEACTNLKKRLCDLVGFNLKVEIRTIDSLCAKLFYKYNKEIGNRKYKIVSINDYPQIALKILEKYGSIICSKYEYVFFDEFQDANETQFHILKQFHHNNSLLTVIGDDNQNIYQWRGTDNTYIINFDNIIKNTKTYNLSTNYRSNMPIITLANNSIKHNKNQISKKMMAVNTNHYIPELKFFIKRGHEFCDMIELIKNHYHKTNSYGTIAVLSRNNSNLKIFEEWLSKYNLENPSQIIPFVSLIDDDNDDKPHINKQMLTLSTVHKTKGLEWNTVILFGLSDFLFPNCYNDSDEGIEEERRLFYVAVTRAKNHLYFYVNYKDIPASRFIKEIVNHVNYINMSGNLKYKSVQSLFNIKENRNCIKKLYSISEIMKLFQQKDFENVRNMGFLDKIEDNMIKINEFHDHISFCEPIKKNFLENDVGIFLNKIIARDILSRSMHQIVKDKDCDELLDAININEDEAELLCKYQLKGKIEGCKVDMDKLEEYCNELRLEGIEKMTINNIIDKVKLCQGNVKMIREHTIPNNFIKAVSNSYDKYRDINKTTKNIIYDIYNVSLVRKVLGNRKRLVYRSVYDIFDKKYERVSDNIDKFLIQKKNNFLFCEVGVDRIFKLTDSIDVEVFGDVFLIDADNGEMVCIKYSETEVKIEWILEQLMLYILLLEKKELTDVITKINIINLLRGKSYVFQIPEKEYMDQFVTYIVSLIKRNTIKTKSNDINDDTVNDEIKITIDNITCETINTVQKIHRNIRTDLEFNYSYKNAKYIMVMDTETTGLDNDSDIIQLSYILHDFNGKIIKKFNKYIKPEFSIITQDSYEIHGISNNFILKNGLKFVDIIQEFLDDLKSTKCLIGHNVAFDIRMIKCCIDKYYIIKKDIFNDIYVICTSAMSRRLFQSPKAMKLTELYTKLFKSKMVNAHNALYDVIYCGKCFFKMMDIVDDYMEPYKNVIIDNIKMARKIRKRIIASKNVYDNLVI